MRIATRGSPLALWQAHLVAGLLQAAGRSSEIVVVETSGDRDKASPLHSIGGKGVFCKEVQSAVLDGRADLAVHSAKDLPALTPPGLVIAAIPERGDPRDALVGTPLSMLPTGATVATGSVRRRAQLAVHRPDLEFRELRGNIATRLEKADGFDAIVMAAAALERLGESVPADVVPVETMVPQVGQAALAIECRIDDSTTRAVLAALDHPATSRCVKAERAFLRELGGDCSMPAAAHATGGADGPLVLLGFLADDQLNNARQLRVDGDDGERLGAELARTLVAALGRA